MSDESFKKFDRPGDIDIQMCRIWSFNGGYLDITNIFEKITIYEDIYRNCIYGNIVLTDSFNLPENMPISGREILELSFSTPTLPQVKRSFQIYQISNQVWINNSTAQTYTLHFTSYPLMVDSITKISKSYKGLYSDIVQNICDDHFSSGGTNPTSFPLEKQETRQERNVVIPYWSPLESINWIASRSLSKEGYSNYLFFETYKTGYRFLSLSSLLLQTPIFNYTYNVGGIDLDVFRGFTTIQKLSIENGFDKLKETQEGIYGSQLITYNITNKEILEKNFNYNEIFDPNKQPHLSPHLLLSPSDPLSSKNQSKIYMKPKHKYLFDNNQDNDEYENWYSKRKSLFSQITIFKIHATIHGNSFLQVGDTINLKIPTRSETISTGKENDEYLSGNWLITAIKHEKVRIDKYNMILELSRESLNKPLPSQQL